MAPTTPQKIFCAFCSLWSPLFHNDVRRFLNEPLPQRWIGRTGQDDKALLECPPRYPDMTPCVFFLWSFIKDRVLVPPIPRDLVELRERIRNEFVAVTSARMDGNGVSPRYMPCHEGSPY
ncbi:uncharacterized protein TNCV_4146861 [Trichonephila clavipes]|nr:uncharacterized protein TNCV_4146861 [Trichonephila clavipes]